MKKLTSVWPHPALQESAFFLPLSPIVGRLEGAVFPGLGELNDVLSRHCPGIVVHSGCAVRFVSQANGKQGFESQYEPRCYLSGEVQLRPENWHDLFNAIVWLSYPKAKAAINALHYQALLDTVITTTSQRGKVRDMVTLLDESGVIVACANAGLADLLVTFQWKDLFWGQRAQVNSAMGFFIFGHGLYEKALQPYIGMTGQGLLVGVAEEFFSWELAVQLNHLDVKLAEYLKNPQHCTSTRELHPVPLLGIPGWAEDNNCEAYYDNTAYFRSGRRSGK